MENPANNKGNSVAKFSILAAVVSLAGLADAAYLTSKHFAGSQVPCSVTGGCETVLTSSYAEFFGIPTAAFGAIAYFLAFSLVLLTYFGNKQMWSIFGGLSVLMAGFSLYLIYLQAFVIGAYCQYCLLSAATSITLFLFFLASKLFASK